MRTLSFATAAAVGSLFISFAAQAADLPARPPEYKAPVIVPASAFNWSGFYIGANIGAGWARADISGSNGSSLGTNTDATFIGGGQMGYNWQINNWVIGIEGSFNGIAGNGKTSPNVVVGANTYNGSADATWTATLAARLGYAFDNVLIYGKGGGGWVGWDGTVNWVNNGTSINGSNSQGGWMAGVGMEFAFARNWTAKIEYNYLGVNGQTLGTINGVSWQVDSPRVQTVVLGVNYLFH